jgi:membrane protein DedA with SNARE-associated domain
VNGVRSSIGTAIYRVLTLARVTHLLVTYGLVVLFLAVAVESAGVPIPGETALVTAAVYASTNQHHFSITWVIVVAAAGAIIGDNVGYTLGRIGGRRLVERIEPLRKALPRGEKFFDRHGGKTVFFGRFVAILRFTAAWVAGLGRMPWWRFLFWNATGGIAWATAVGLVAFYGGKTAADAIARYGLFAAGGIVVILVLGFLVVHYGKKRLEERL